MTKLIVYKYSSDNGLYTGNEEAIPHPKTGELQIPFYTTKLVPPDKRPGFQIMFKEKEGSLPGMGIGSWELIKEVNIIYYNKNNGIPYTASNLNTSIDLNLYTTKSPNSNKYGICYIENVTLFNNETNEWEIDFNNLKDHIVKLLKLSRDKIFYTPLKYKNISFDTNQATRQRINENITRFSVESINLDDIFDTEIQIDLEILKKSNIIPWIDANNNTVSISPNMLVGLNYLIGFKDLIVVKLYNELRQKIYKIKSIEKLYKLLPNLNKDLEDGFILEFENLKFDEETVLKMISKIDKINLNKYLEDNKIEDVVEEVSDKVIENVVDEPLSNIKNFDTEDDSDKGTPVYDTMGNIITYIKQ